MLTVERQQRILDVLENKKVVKIQELVEATGASESTIRRDLTELENAKKLKRIHGGAAWLKRKLEEPTILEKTSKNSHEKQQIAGYASKKVKAGDCIFLDAGTTTYEIIPFLQGKDVVAVTNGLDLIARLLEYGVETYVTGGYVKGGTHAFVGRGAIESIGSYRFDKCFIGTNAIDEEFGLTTPDPDEAFVKEMAIRYSEEAYVLADHTKFGETSFAKFAELKESVIITSDQLDEPCQKTYKNLTTLEVVKT